VTDKKY